MPAVFQVGQIGAKIRCTANVDGSAPDLTTYDDVHLQILKPDFSTLVTYERSEGELSYETDGTDGKVNRVTTLATELDQAGTYYCQLRLIDGSTVDVPSHIESFRVDANLQ